jgi:hypothetical protein
MGTTKNLCLMTMVSCVWACGHTDINRTEGVSVVGVAPIGNDLAYVQSNGVVQRITVLSDNPSPTTSKTTVTSQPRLMVKRPTAATGTPSEELLVVSDGRSDEYGQVLEKPSLTALTANGDKRVYALEDPGQQMRLSDDGQFAILFNDPSYVDSSSLLTNPGEVAIVDLNPDSQDKNPTIRNLDTVGGPPNSVWFPTLTVGVSKRRFAFFTFPDGVSLIDLADPTQPGHKLDLSGWLPSGGINTSAGFAMAVDPSSNEIYLKTNTSKYVETITVMPSTTDTSGVDVSLKQLTVGNVAPGAIDVYASTAGTQLVATLNTAVALVATDEDSVTTVGLTYPADRILRFTAASPDDPNPKQRALLYSLGQAGVTFANLESLAKDTDRALQAVDFGQAISTIRQVEFMPEQVLVFLTGGGVDILDLATRRWVPVDSPVPLNIVVADGGGKVWVSNPGDSRISFLDFGDATTRYSTFTVKSTVKLDDAIQQFYRMDGSGHSRVVVTHDQVGGAVTLLDAQNPQRSSAKKLEGFLFSNLY